MKGKFFERPCEKTGEAPKFTRTTNCLVRAEKLKSIPGPFDPKYGLTGGSDTHLFTTLFNLGAKYFSCTRELFMIMFIPIGPIINGFFKDLSEREILILAEFSNFNTT